jgi:hypothetical protein
MLVVIRGEIELIEIIWRRIYKEGEGNGGR